jgi:xylulokinase
MKYFLTLDVGTTAVKAGLFNENLDLITIAFREYSLIYPRADFIEMDPDLYWEKVRESISEVLLLAKIDNPDIAALTCTTQGETLIPIGKDGRHLSNAIVWIDSRAKNEADHLIKHFDQLEIYQTTGLPEINAYCPISKILWLKNNLPNIYDQAEKILLLEDYLVFKFTGKFVSNPTMMCTTGYFDINTNNLWTEILEQNNINPSKFPTIIDSGCIIGNILPEIAKELGLSPNLKVTSGAMDQVSSAVGSNNLATGNITETTGTCQVIAITSESKKPFEWSPAAIYKHAIKDKYLKIILNQTAGIAYKWFRNEFCKDLIDDDGDAFRIMDELAEKEPPLSKGLTFFPHMTGMVFPFSDETLKGVFFGVSLNTSRGCFIRSIMEGVGYMLKESIEEMRLHPSSITSLGGGAKSPLWCQIKANICETKITVMKNNESTSLGAAVIGGVAVGIFDNFESASDHIVKKFDFYPMPELIAVYERGFSEYKSMYGAFSPIFHSRSNNN